MEARHRIRSGFVKSTEPSSASFEQQRREWEDGARLTPLPPNVSAAVVSAGGIPALLVSAPGLARDRLLIHFHGGGFTSGSSVTHRSLAAQIVLTAGLPVLLVDYRLAPEHPFPSARDDALAAYRWALQQGYSSDRIAVSGDSAGAHVAVTAVLALRDAGDPLPAVVALLSPWLDFTQSGDSMRTRATADPLVTAPSLADCARHYLADLALDHPSVSPLTADLHNFPSLWIQVGDDEVLLDDSTRFIARARAAGTDAQLFVWPEMWHVFQAWAPDLPEATAALAQLGDHVRSLTDRAASATSQPGTAR